MIAPDDFAALRPLCTRAHPSRNSVAPSAHTCTPDNGVSSRLTWGQGVPQWCLLVPHVGTGRAAMLSPRASRGDRACRNAVSSCPTCGQGVPQCCLLVPTCGQGVPQCCLLVPTCGHSVPQRCPAVLHLGASPRRLLTCRQNRPTTFATTSEIVRPSMLAAVGGTGVLDSTSVPYRCGS